MRVQPLSLLPEDAAFSFVAQGAHASYVASLSTDRRLAATDIAGTLAHVASLRDADLVSRQEAKVIAAALRTCLEEIRSSSFPWQEGLEDVHTNIEARVLALASDAGEKIHAARSRNDQVALDERLYVRLEIEHLLQKIAALQRALLAQAKGATQVIVPGYTHLRKAQPVLLAHAFLAHFWRLSRDAERLHDAYARVNVSPAGAAAIAGTSLPVDVHVVADLLGFDRMFANSIDATSDRDFLVEVTADLALAAVHLSNLAEDLVLWSSAEFGWVHLSDTHVAGSSLLPNKRNPDLLELVRGQAGTVIGDLVSLLTMLKALPLGYNRDLQGDKASAFQALDAVGASLEVLADVVAALRVDAAKASSGLGPAESGVLLVEHLVAQGLPYREAYDVVKARLGDILSASDEGERLSALRKTSRLFGEDALGLLTPSGAVTAVTSHGGTGPAAVEAQIHEAEGTLGRQAYHLNLIAKKNRRIADVLSGEAGP